MSLGFYPAVDPPLRSLAFSAHPDGCCELVRFCEHLDRLATESGWRPLSSFADTRLVPDGFEGDSAELSELLGPWLEWFSPEDALPTIVGLSRALQQNPAGVCDIADSARLVSELRALEDLLRAAAVTGSRFRLEVVE